MLWRWPPARRPRSDRRHTRDRRHGQDTSDRSAFESNSSSIVGSTLTFSNLTFDDGAFTIGSGGSVLGSGLMFFGCLQSGSPCTSNSGLVVGGLQDSSGSWNGGSDPALATSQQGYNPGNSATITIALPAGVYAIGFDILVPNTVSTNSPPQFGVLVNNVGPATYSAVETNLLGSVFFGYSSATEIRGITIYAQNFGSFQSALGIDNVDVGSLTLGSGSSGGSGSGSGNGPSATPEASTMLTWSAPASSCSASHASLPVSRADTRRRFPFGIS